MSVCTELFTEVETDVVPALEVASIPAVPMIDLTRPMHESQEIWVGYFEREYVKRLLASVDFDLDRAARVAGLSREDLESLLTTYCP